MNFPAARRILVSTVPVSMIAVMGCLAIPRPVAADWQQTEFAIGTWLDPPITGSPEALPTNKRTYKVAKDSYVSLFSGWPSFFPAAATGSTPMEVQRVRFAAAHAVGVKVMVADTAIATGRTLAAQTCAVALPFTPERAESVLALYSEPELTPAEKSAHGGYFLGDEPPDNSCWVLRQRQWTQAIHQHDPGQPAWINLLPHAFVNLQQQWLGPSAAGTNSVPDILSIAQYPFVNGELVLPDDDRNGWPDHDGRRFLENMAITKAKIGPSRAFWHLVDAWNLEHDANPAFDFDDPTPAHLRLYSFCPVAHGVTGIIFFGYSHAFSEDVHPENPEIGLHCATGTRTPCSEAVVSRGFIPTRKYRTIREISHYLHDLVGPMIMRTTYRGTWHRDAHPENGDTWYVPASRLAGPNSPIVKSISDDRSMVGVFQGKGSDSNTWYLLVVNKDPRLDSFSTTIELHPSLRLAVGAAPSAVGYVGGTTYSRVKLMNNAFTVSLEGGEGRLFRLTPTGVGTFLTLVSPAGGETWTANQQKTVSWDDPSASVTVRLFTDVLEDDAELHGPYVDLATNATGGQVTVTVPPVHSNRARIEISAQDGGGGVRRASHRVPLKVRAIGGSPSTTTWSVAGADGFLQADLHLTGSDVPTVLSFGDASRRVNQSAYDGQNWTTSTLVDNSCTNQSENLRCVPEPNGSYGYSPSFRFTPSGVGHAAFYTFYKTRLNGFSSPWGSSFSLHYGSQASPASPWVFNRAYVVGSVDGDCAIAVNSQGVPHIAFNAGYPSGYEMRVIRKEESGWVEWSGPSYPGNPQHVRAQFDAADRLWITFLSGDQAKLYVLRQNDQGTSVTLAVNGTCMAPSLALDASDNVHLSYGKAGTLPGSATLHYRRFNGTSWSAEETVDGSMGTIADAAITVSGTTPKIVYARNGVITVAAPGPGSWVFQALETTSDADGQVSARVSKTGTLWASYRDRASNRLMVTSSAPSGGGCSTCEAGAVPVPRVRSLQLRIQNPLSGRDGMRFELKLSRPAEVRARLFDIGGRLAAAYHERHGAAESSEIRWDVSQVPPGVYFVEASLDGEVMIRRKFVILK